MSSISSTGSFMNGGSPERKLSGEENLSAQKVSDFKQTKHGSQIDKLSETQIQDLNRHKMLNLENSHMTTSEIEGLIDAIEVNGKHELIESLILTNNEMESLPKNLDKLTSLKKLYADGNNISTISEAEIKTLNKFSYIDLKFNLGLSTESKTKLNELKKEKAKNKEHFIMYYSLTGDELNSVLNYSPIAGSNSK